MKRIGLWKKVSALVLCGCMVIGCLAGCGSEGKQSEESSSQNKESSVASTSVAESSAEVEKEPVKLTMWSSWGGTNLPGVKSADDTVFYQTIQEACNVDLEFVDTSGSTTTMSVLIGTNSLPDIIYCGAATISGGIESLLAADLIYPLNELMDKGWLPNLKAIFESDPEVDKLAKNDAGQYAWLPQIYAPDTPTTTEGYIIRKDWLDELGLKVPTTIAEMEEVLLAFKEKKGADSGLEFSWKGTSPFANSWNVLENFYTEGDGIVKYGFMEDSYKEYLTLANKWIDLGILDPDTFTQEQDVFWAKMATGKTGLVYGFLGGEFNKIKVMQEENPGMNWVAIAAPSLEAGQKCPVDVGAYRVVNANGIFIPRTCKDPEAAARILDYWVSEEGIALTRYGIEGITYEMVDGEPVFTELVTNNPDGLSITDAVSLYAGQILNNPGYMTRSGRMMSYTMEQQLDALDAWTNSTVKTKALPPISMTQEELDEFNMLYTDIQTYVNENKLNFILGSKSLDKFEEFREGLLDMGIERVIELKQAAYDRFMAR